MWKRINTYDILRYREWTFYLPYFTKDFAMLHSCSKKGFKFLCSKFCDQQKITYKGLESNEKVTPKQMWTRLMWWWSVWWHSTVAPTLVILACTTTVHPEHAWHWESYIYERLEIHRVVFLTLVYASLQQLRRACALDEITSDRVATTYIHVKHRSENQQCNCCCRYPPSCVKSPSLTSKYSSISTSTFRSTGHHNYSNSISHHQSNHGSKGITSADMPGHNSQHGGIPNHKSLDRKGTGHWGFAQASFVTKATASTATAAAASTAFVRTAFATFVHAATAAFSAGAVRPRTSFGILFVRWKNAHLQVFQEVSLRQKVNKSGQTSLPPPTYMPAQVF